MVKKLPAMWETQVWSLGQKDSLEKWMATHSSIVTWRIPWTEEAGGLQSMGLQRVGHEWATNTFTLSASLVVAQMLKSLPAMHETQVWSLGREDSLEKGMATHSNILAWRIPWTGGLTGYSPWGCRHNWATNTFTSHIILFLLLFLFLSPPVSHCSHTPLFSCFSLVHTLFSGTCPLFLSGFITPGRRANHSFNVTNGI